MSGASRPFAALEHYGTSSEPGVGAREWSVPAAVVAVGPTSSPGEPPSQPSLRMCLLRIKVGPDGSSYHFHDDPADFLSKLRSSALFIV
mmetsp:Transcript_97418/g.244211  ORF Transcript_97418/g.244211 Transcript_97418/m.244211 type:complete len:89 (-) Transcript_97418:60-326(-)